MNLSRNSETSLAVQPSLVYEHDSFSSVGYIGEVHSSNPDTRRIVGFEAIDSHLEGLLENWEETGDVDAAIDATTIISQFPGHYPLPSKPLQEALIACVLKELAKVPEHPEIAREIVIRCHQVPELYQQVTDYVRTRLDSSDVLDTVVQEPTVSAYLSAFTRNELGHDGQLEALRYLLTPCKLDDSEL